MGAFFYAKRIHAHLSADESILRHFLRKIISGKGGYNMAV